MTENNCNCEQNKFENERLIAEVLKKYEGKKGSLMPILQEVQSAFGYLPKDLLKKIAAETRTPMSRIYGVATFYSQFRLAPVGKDIIRVCHGTACHVAGSENITLALESKLEIANGQTTADKQFTLESVACLGCCSLAPVVMVNKDTYGSLTPDKAKKLIKKYEQKEN